MAKAKIGIVTVSDRASAGVYEDISGKAIIETLNAYLTSEWESVYEVIPDEREVIEATLKRMADEDGCCLVVTTGGTGPAKRDVTPEATEAVCDRMMPGFGELMRAESLKFVPTAILSRQTAGLRDDTLIVNLPGKPKSIRECLDAVFPAIPYCIDLMEGPFLECDEAVIKPFRPKAKSATPVFPRPIPLGFGGRVSGFRQSKGKPTLNLGLPFLLRPWGLDQRPNTTFSPLSERSSPSTRAAAMANVSKLDTNSCSSGNSFPLIKAISACCCPETGNHCKVSGAMS